MKSIVYDVAYIPSRDLYAYACSDHSISIVKEKEGYGELRMIYMLHNRIFHQLMHTRWGRASTYTSDWHWHALSTHPVDTLCQHTLLTHPASTPDWHWHTLLVHPIDTLVQCAPSTHPVNTSCQHALSTHPVNTPCQHTLSTHPINTP